MTFFDGGLPSNCGKLGLDILLGEIIPLGEVILSLFLIFPYSDAPLLVFSVVLGRSLAGFSRQMLLSAGLHFVVTNLLGFFLLKIILRLSLSLCLSLSVPLCCDFKSLDIIMFLYALLSV